MLPRDRPEAPLERVGSGWQPRWSMGEAVVLGCLIPLERTKMHLRSSGPWPEASGKGLQIFPLQREASLALPRPEPRDRRALGSSCPPSLSAPHTGREGGREGRLWSGGKTQGPKAAEEAWRGVEGGQAALESHRPPFLHSQALCPLHLPPPPSALRAFPSGWENRSREKTTLLPSAGLGLRHQLHGGGSGRPSRAASCPPPGGLVSWHKWTIQKTPRVSCN